MVLSFWLLPGLDACPVEEGRYSPTMAEAASLGLDPAGWGESSDTASSSFFGEGGVEGEELSGGYNGQHEGSCFQEANVVGSVRAMLKVSVNSYVMFCVCLFG